MIDTPTRVPAHNPALWRRIINRFGLRSGIGGNSHLLLDIQPVVDMDRVAELVRHQSATVSVVAGSGYILFTVPNGERWHLLAFQGVQDAGDYAYNLRIQNIETNSGGFIDLTPPIANGGADILERLVGITLDEGNTIRVFGTSHVTAGDFSGRIFYLLDDCTS